MATNSVVVVEADANPDGTTVDHLISIRRSFFHSAALASSAICGPSSSSSCKSREDSSRSLAEAYVSFPSIYYKSNAKKQKMYKFIHFILWNVYSWCAVKYPTLRPAIIFLRQLCTGHEEVATDSSNTKSRVDTFRIYRKIGAHVISSRTMTSTLLYTQTRGNTVLVFKLLVLLEYAFFVW